MLSGHGLDLSEPHRPGADRATGDDPLFTSMAVRAADGCLSIVYKAAAEIGELGDNVAALRRAMSTDTLARAGAGFARRPRDGRRPHPMGERRAHLGAERPPAQLRRGRRRRARPLRHRRPQRRRRQLPRTDRLRRRCGAGRGHHRRQARAHPRRSLHGGRVGPGRGVPPGRGPFRWVRRHRRQCVGPPGRALPCASRERSEPQYRPGRGRFHRRQRTVRPCRGNEPLRPHGRRGRRPGGHVLAKRRRHPRRDYPPELRRHRISRSARRRSKWPR